MTLNVPQLYDVGLAKFHYGGPWHQSLHSSPRMGHGRATRHTVRAHTHMLEDDIRGTTSEELPYIIDPTLF